MDTTRKIKWGENVLEFIQDSHNPDIFHCKHFSVHSDFLKDEPRKIFETLIKRGWIKMSEVVL